MIILAIAIAIGTAIVSMTASDIMRERRYARQLADARAQHERRMAELRAELARLES